VSIRKSRVAIAVGCVALLGAGAIAAKKLRHRAQGAGQADSESSESTFRVAPPREVSDAANVIYDGHLADGWSDWGWGPHELPAHGPAAITFSGYGGIILQHTALQQPIGGVSFRFRAPSAWGDFLHVTLKLSGGQDSLFKTVLIEPRYEAVLPDGFREALIPWHDLNPTNAPFDRVVISAAIPVASQPVLLDKILLLKGDGAAAKADVSQAPQRRAELEILCSAEAHPISPLIYGSAGGDPESGQTAERFGGNPTSRENWDLKAWNSGNDWFFLNQPGLDVAHWLDTVASHGERAAITVPMIGWVAKDTTSVGFPASKFPKQRKFEPNRSDAGDGFQPDGKPITPGSPEQTSVPAPPELIGKWVRALRDSDRLRSPRALDMYILDNEPTIWDQTHRDVHPNPVTYDELLDRTIKYASEVRRADPDTKIAGPAEWGWMGYFYSGKDRVEGKFVRSDRRAHGDVPLLPWYLKQLAQYEKDHGTRLLDVLDVHYYPAAEGVYGGNARTDYEGAALRLRATRSLWDETYTDESWIAESVRLIPRLKEWVSANYPGLGISLGEWSFGADNHISGALATAESLGRFGQQGLYSAFYWLGPRKDTATFWAFRAFRNFDGAGGRFQDFSLATRESRDISLFASRDGSGSHVVAVLINRDAVFAQVATVSVLSCGRVKAERRFEYRAGLDKLEERTGESPRSDRVSAVLPPYSITVLDLQIEPVR